MLQRSSRACRRCTALSAVVDNYLFVFEERKANSSLNNADLAVLHKLLPLQAQPNSTNLVWQLASMRGLRVDYSTGAVEVVPFGSASSNNPQAIGS
mmetsp:Transcript_54146/g.127264  ORF Transcript_54146/g.127264 Transcript_54146/m.127264 type:complete len:96 (+) Transcript_54146:140-427(+)